jgi:hypothetical protein
MMKASSEGAHIHPISEMCPFITNGHDIDKLLEQRGSRLINPDDRAKPPHHIKQQKYPKPLGSILLINGQKKNWVASRRMVFFSFRWQGGGFLLPPQLALMIRNQNQWAKQQDVNPVKWGLLSTLANTNKISNSKRVYYTWHDDEPSSSDHHASQVHLYKERRDLLAVWSEAATTCEWVRPWITNLVSDSCISLMSSKIQKKWHAKEETLLAE